MRNFFLDIQPESVYNGKACENMPCFCAQKLIYSNHRHNITGGETNANIQPVSEEGKTDFRQEVYGSGVSIRPKKITPLNGLPSAASSTITAQMMIATGFIAYPDSAIEYEVEFRIS